MQDSELLLSTSRFDVVRRQRIHRSGCLESREVVRHPGGVGIVPLLGDSRVCLIRNDRLAVHRTLIEIPAGTLEPAEDPAAAAWRELKEETGFSAGRLQPLGTLWMSPGILHERMHLFVAEDLRPGPPQLEATESIDPLLLDWEEALAMTERGEIQDAKTVAALLLFERKRRLA